MSVDLDLDALWFDHNCHVPHAEPCESCGSLVAYRLGRDWRRDWFLLTGVAGHTGDSCEDCESWWQRHTPDQCRAVRAGAWQQRYDRTSFASGTAALPR